MISGDKISAHSLNMGSTEKNDLHGSMEKTVNLYGNDSFLQSSPPSTSFIKGTEPSTPSSLASGSSTIVVFPQDFHSTTYQSKCQDLSINQNFISINLKEVSSSSKLSLGKEQTKTLLPLNYNGVNSLSFNLHGQKTESADLFSSQNSVFLSSTFDSNCGDSSGGTYSTKNQQRKKGSTPLQKTIMVNMSSTVNDLKSLIYRETHIPPYKQHLFFRGQKLSECREENYSLSNNEQVKVTNNKTNNHRQERNIGEYGIVNDGETVLLLIKSPKKNSQLFEENTKNLQKTNEIQLDLNSGLLKKENIALLNNNNIPLLKDISSLSFSSSDLSAHSSSMNKGLINNSTESLSYWSDHHSTSTSSGSSTEVETTVTKNGNNQNKEKKNKSGFTSNTLKNSRGKSPTSNANQANLNIMVRGAKLKASHPAPFFRLYDGPIIPAELPKVMNISIKNIQRSFILGKHPPKRADDGTGGSYFMMDCDRKLLGVFKPHDEEPFTPNNPKNKFVRDFPGNNNKNRKHGDEDCDILSRHLKNQNSLSNGSSHNSSLLGPFHFTYSLKNYVTEIDDTLFRMFPGSIPGEGYLREVGAYLIDRRQGHVAGVPATTICESYHPAYNYSSSGSSNTNSSLGTAKPGDPFSVKYGSFQQYIRNDGDMDDWSPTNFSVYEVQKIALLDIRILNLDRNDGNILVQRERKKSNNLHSPKSSPGGSYTEAFSLSSSISSNSDSYAGGSFRGGEEEYEFKLIPIDHGYAFPENLEVDEINLCWSTWKQIKEPIHPQLVDVILNWNIEEDQDLLRTKLGIKEKALDNFKVMSLLLQTAVKANLKHEEERKKEAFEQEISKESITLFDVFRMVVREGFEDDGPSELEKMISACEELAMQSLLLSRTKHFRKQHNRGLTHGEIGIKKQDNPTYGHFINAEADNHLGILQLDQSMSKEGTVRPDESTKDSFDALDVSSTTLTASLRLQSFQEEDEDEDNNCSTEKYEETNGNIEWLNDELDKEMEREKILTEQREYSSFRCVNETKTDPINISKPSAGTLLEMTHGQGNSTGLQLPILSASHSSSSFSSYPSSPLPSSYMTPISNSPSNICQFPFSTSLSSEQNLNGMQMRGRSKKKDEERDDRDYLYKDELKVSVPLSKPADKKELQGQNQVNIIEETYGHVFEGNDDVSTSSSSDSDDSSSRSSYSSSSSSDYSTSDSDSDSESDSNSESDALSIFIGNDDDSEYDESYLAQTISCSPRTTSMHINSFIEKVKKDFERKTGDILPVNQNRIADLTAPEINGSNTEKYQSSNNLTRTSFHDDFLGHMPLKGKQYKDNSSVGMLKDTFHPVANDLYKEFGKSNEQYENSVDDIRSSHTNEDISCKEINTTNTTCLLGEPEQAPSLSLTRSISTPNFISTNGLRKPPNSIPQFIKNTFAEGLRTPLSSANSSSINLSSKLSDITSNENSYIGPGAPGTLSRGRSAASSDQWQMKLESNIRHSVEFRTLFFDTLQECFEHTMSRKLLYKIRKRTEMEENGF